MEKVAQERRNEEGMVDALIVKNHPRIRLEWFQKTTENRIQDGRTGIRTQSRLARAIIIAGSSKARHPQLEVTSTEGYFQYQPPLPPHFSKQTHPPAVPASTASQPLVSWCRSSGGASLLGESVDTAHKNGHFVCSATSLLDSALYVTIHSQLLPLFSSLFYVKPADPESAYRFHENIYSVSPFACCRKQLNVGTRRLVVRSQRDRSASSLVYGNDATIVTKRNTFSALPTRILRRVWSNAGMKLRGEREIPEKTRRLTSSPGTILTCEDSEWPGRGLNPDHLVKRYAGNAALLARRSDEALGVRVTVARIAHLVGWRLTDTPKLRSPLAAGRMWTDAGPSLTMAHIAVSHSSCWEEADAAVPPILCHLADILPVSDVTLVTRAAAVVGTKGTTYVSNMSSLVSNMSLVRNMSSLVSDVFWNALIQSVPGGILAQPIGDVLQKSEEAYNPLKVLTYINNARKSNPTYIVVDSGSDRKTALGCNTESGYCAARTSTLLHIPCTVATSNMYIYLRLKGLTKLLRCTSRIDLSGQRTMVRAHAPSVEDFSVDVSTSRPGFWSAILIVRSKERGGWKPTHTNLSCRTSACHQHIKANAAFFVSQSESGMAHLLCGYRLSLLNYIALEAAVAERLARSPPTKANRAQSPAGSPDFRKWESCRAMPLVGGSSRGSPVSPAPSFRRRSIFTSTTLIGRPNLFTSLYLKRSHFSFIRRYGRSIFRRNETTRCRCQDDVHCNMGNMGMLPDKCKAILANLWGKTQFSLQLSIHAGRCRDIANARGEQNNANYGKWRLGDGDIKCMLSRRPIRWRGSARDVAWSVAAMLSAGISAALALSAGRMCALCPCLQAAIWLRNGGRRWHLAVAQAESCMKLYCADILHGVCENFVSTEYTKMKRTHPLNGCGVPGTSCVSDWLLNAPLMAGLQAGEWVTRRSGMLQASDAI
ncbi:hypothetical protein PR048_032851 [Dryococelus australis]|uniref:Uncharacterized protein n=1 Tax=Dryococelus australis TaxID=614101 RepID=A0ABQ9G3D5_9NEOP|nr:hypothetical protein PR048_032851 [Dryococelus australis]